MDFFGFFGYQSTQAVQSNPLGVFQAGGLESGLSFAEKRAVFQKKIFYYKKSKFFEIFSKTVRDRGKRRCPGDRASFIRLEKPKMSSLGPPVGELQPISAKRAISADISILSIPPLYYLDSAVFHGEENNSLQSSDLTSTLFKSLVIEISILRFISLKS